MKPWPLKPLEEIAELFGGSTPSRENPSFWGGDIPWVTPTDLPMPDEGISVVSKTKERITRAGLDNSSATVVPKGTVLFSSRATIGKVAVANMPLTTNQGFANFVPHPKVTSRFLAYALWVRREDIARLSGSTTFKEVSRSTLRKYQLPVPPLAEQERIVRLLDEADELQKLRAQADHRTADLIPALFHEMFGSLERSLPSSTLGELVRDFRYGTSNKSASDGKPTLRIPNVLEQAVNLDDLKFVPVSDLDFDRLRLKDGDLLFVRTNGNANNVGRSAVFDVRAINVAGYDADEFIYASYLIRARLQVEKVLPLFVQHFLASPEGRRALRARAKTSAGQFNINTEGLGTLPIPVPPLPLQEEFAKRVTEIRDLEAKQAASRERLDALFQSMLHRAFRSEL
jgi:type I restriction enzyme, S subunit